MKLSELATALNSSWSGQADPELNGVSQHSQDVQSGDLFFVSDHSGLQYVSDARKQGAVAISVAQSLSAEEFELPCLIHDDDPAALRQISRQLYRKDNGDPVDQDLCLWAVTGTNGKSTVVQWLRESLQALGHSVLSSGTLGAVASQNRASRLTTPPFCELLRLLRDHPQCQHAVIEVSSHALVQRRLGDLKFDCALFTNFGHDHLDFHGSLEKYYAAKRSLLGYLKPEGFAVAHGDEDSAQLLKQETDKPVFWCEDFSQTLNLPVQGPLFWRNANLVLTALNQKGFNKEDILNKALPSWQSVPGRFQEVAPEIFVDYAHTPDALEAVLKNARSLCQGQIILLFGCGGDREHSKRRLMGEVAAAFADQVVVTDDNPRFEDPAAIRRMIMAGCPQAIEISGRREAIAEALSLKKPGDFLVVAGKGHESSQNIGGTKHDFDDAKVIAECLEKAKV